MSRPCACPCGRPLPPTASAERVYFDVSGRCRQRAYRANVKAEMQAAGLPPTATLAVARAARPTARHSAGPRSGDRARSGRQISYARATGELAAALHAMGLGSRHARREANRILSGALSDRQRARHDRSEAR